MTSEDGLRVLGPLEARVDGRSVPLGGAKQRSALAVLLLQAGEVVPVERLVDELWGDDPPASAVHSLEAYVSRLRRTLAGLGVTVERRGPGYVLELGDAKLDARTFAALREQAGAAATAGEHERAAALADAALALWRGDALADVPLGALGRGEAERLEESRLLLVEQRVDSMLLLGRHGAVVGELQALVRRHPYRERLVALLMLALYRAGRPADALEAYEATRLRLADELGLQPGTELRELSGLIVRHDPSLRAPVARPASRPPLPPPRRRGRAWLALAATAALSLVLVGSGSVRQVAGAVSQPGVRIALVLPAARTEEPGGKHLVYASRLRESRAFDPELAVPTILDGDDARAAATVARGDFDLVLWAGDGAEARAFAPRVHELPRTRFVFLDASLETLGLRGAPNATAVRFAREESGELVGLISGMIDARGADEPGETIAIVADVSTPSARRAVAGFRRGVRNARRGVEVSFDAVPREADRGRCERVANAQIDEGADVVYAVGPCGAAVAAVARIRGVWAVADEDVVDAAEHVLVRTYVDRAAAIDLALARFRAGTLPAGGELRLGLVDDYAVGIDSNHAVPAWISSAAVRRCSALRAHAAGTSS